MPLKKSADTLKSICLKHIATNPNFWLEDVDETNAENYHGIFECLPYTVLLDLLSFLHQKMLLTHNQLPFLLHVNMEHLDLSEYFSGRLDTYFYDHLTDLISSRCHKLKYLNLALCSKVRSTALVQLVKTLPKIEVLNLRSTAVSDAVLFALGANCRRLQILDVSDNDVTDVGLSALCVNLGHKSQSSGCLKLCSLYVETTSITEMGVLRALVSLPHLKIFRHDHTCAGLPLYLGNYKNHVVQTTNKFMLEILIIKNWQSTAEHFMQVAEFFVDNCPNITELKLYFREPLEPIPTLTHFLHLQDLTILSCDHLMFDGFIANVLKQVGAQLKVLTLFCTPRFTVIAQCCPHLHSLYVCNPLEAAGIALTEEKSMNLYPFQHLETLSIQHINCHSGVSYAQLVYVLSNCRKLKMVYLGGCVELTDQCLRTILKANSFYFLENLVFQDCCNISPGSIMNFISLDNPMNIMIIDSCAQITYLDFLSMKKRVVEENLDLDITWT